MQSAVKILKFITGHPLAGRHKTAALYKFAKWQISQLLSPGLVEYPFIGDTKFWARKGMAAATANIYTGLQEFEEMAFLLHFLRPSDVFVDVGANIGTYSLLATGVAGARSISIEPIPSTFEMLSKNITLNKIETKVLPLNMGVSSEKDSLYFTSDSDSVNHVILNGGEDKNLTRVEVNSLDNILKDEQCPALIKVDVEDFEYAVIKGAANTLADKSLKAIIIELIGGGERYGFNEDDIHDQLLQHGFSWYHYLPFERKLTVNGATRSNNRIYLRDIDFVENRLASANRIKVSSMFLK